MVGCAQVLLGVENPASRAGREDGSVLNVQQYRRSLSCRRQSADTFRMWSIFGGIAVAAGAIALIVRSRQRAARQQPIEVGAVTEGWLAQHRGSRQG